MGTSAPWGQRTAQAQVCPRNTNISLLSCSILRFTKMTLSREMKKSCKGKRKENQWKQREYKYTENHAQALHKFYSYIPNLAVLSISQSRIQKVDIHKHKLCIFFSEGPVAIEILLETVSVSAIQSKMSLFSAELLAKPYRHCNVNLTETVLQRDHIPTSSLTQNVRKAPREGWRHVSYLLHHSNVTSVDEHSLSSLMRLEPNMASLVYGSIHSPYWNVCFYRILPAPSSFFYAMAF